MAVNVGIRGCSEVKWTITCEVYQCDLPRRRERRAGRQTPRDPIRTDRRVLRDTGTLSARQGPVLAMAVRFNNSNPLKKFPFRSAAFPFSLGSSHPDAWGKILYENTCNL